MHDLKACPVCGSSAIRLAYRATTTRGSDGREWQVDECTNCSLGFMNPQPTWDEMQEYYSTSYEAYKPDHGAVAAEEELANEARRTGRFRHVEIIPGMKVLDVGCGGGLFLRVAARLGARVQGVEPSEVGAERARALGTPVFCGTLEQFADQIEERYDLITANHVLEHVPNPVGVLRCMAGLLAEGGLIWLSVPNAACCFSRWMPGVWHSADLPYHLLHFTPKSLIEAARRAGLAVEDLATYSLPSALAASLSQLLRRKFLVPARLTSGSRLMLSIAKRVGGWLDRRTAGEALLIRLRKPQDVHGSNAMSEATRYSHEAFGASPS